MNLSIYIFILIVDFHKLMKNEYGCKMKKQNK